MRKNGTNKLVICALIILAFKVPCWRWSIFVLVKTVTFGLVFSQRHWFWKNPFFFAFVFLMNQYLVFIFFACLGIRTIKYKSLFLKCFFNFQKFTIMLVVEKKQG